MSEKILIVLGFNAGDAVLAERLLDWCAELNNKKQLSNPILLVAAPNAHEELQTKVRIAAEIAFRSVEMFVARPATGDKNAAMNKLFKSASLAAMLGYKMPWLWLEPDCVPLRRMWIEELEAAYDDQPKRFMGSRLGFMANNEQRMCLTKVAIYPQNAYQDMAEFCDSIPPFNQFAAEILLARSTKNPLFQHLEVRGPEDTSKIRPDACLLHSDKGGFTIESIRRIRSTVPDVAPTPAEPPAVKIDGRTKAGRNRKAETAAAPA